MAQKLYWCDTQVKYLNESCGCCLDKQKLGRQKMNQYDEFPNQAEQKSRPRHGSKFFYHLLERMAEIHDKKSADYASNDSPYGNYLFAGELSKLFDNPDDSGFLGRIGEKLYRLANLENPIAKGITKTPNFEFIEDTEIDICVITLLWMSCRREIRQRIKDSHVWIGGAAGGGKTDLLEQQARDAMRDSEFTPFQHVGPSGGQVFNPDPQMDENRRVINEVKDTLSAMTPSHRREIKNHLDVLSYSSKEQTRPGWAYNFNISPEANEALGTIINYLESTGKK